LFTSKVANNFARLKGRKKESYLPSHFFYVLSIITTTKKIRKKHVELYRGGSLH